MTTGQRIVSLLLLLSLAAGVATGSQLYYRIAFFWALLFFGSWLWSVLAVRKIGFRRSARTLRAQVGQIFEERFEIQNNSRLPRIWLEVRDNTSLPGSDGSRVLTLIEGKLSRSYLARTRLVQRGVFPLGPTTLGSGDLFGLFPKSISLPAQDALLVYPMMVDIQSFPNPPGLLPGGEALRRRTHQVTPNASGVREYVTGDPLNRIHWMSTARRGRLIVKEFELDPLADVWVFLDAERAVQAALPTELLRSSPDDLWRRSEKISLPPSTEEYGVSIAASLVRDYLRRGRAVGLVSAGQQVTLIAPDRGGRQLGKILEALALLKADGHLPLRALVETQVKHMVRGSTVVLITPSIDRDTPLVADYLLQRGLKPVVVLLDVASFGGTSGTQAVLAGIKVLGVPTRLVANGANLEVALSGEYRSS
ncbi:MAG TPA: DUF58 domain-containing protein [Anaerolineales bacterium]|nr:DUF58 domain-containing protein [Anaerolineales bacterium]